MNTEEQVYDILRKFFRVEIDIDMAAEEIIRLIKKRMTPAQWFGLVMAIIIIVVVFFCFLLDDSDDDDDY